MPEFPLTLAIETSNPSSATPGWTAIAIGRCDGMTPTVLSTAALQPIDRHDDALLPAIDRACSDAGVEPANLQRVAVSIGPGGFTALRIAATVAKMLSLAHATECVAVPTASALVRRVDAPRNADLGVALAWKRDSVWFERYRDPATRLSAGLEPLEAINPASCSAIICDERFERSLRALHTIGPGTVFLRPHFDAVAVLEASATRQPTPALEFAPFYPREPEAVTKWRELHA